MTDTMPQILESPPIPAEQVPPSPGEIRVTKTSPTAAELENYLAAWLRKAEEKGGALDTLALIGRVLAEPGEPYRLSNRTPPRRFRVGDVCLHYTAQTQVFTTDRAIDGEFEMISVTIGGEPPFECAGGAEWVVHALWGPKFSNSGPLGISSELKEKMAGNFYLPGEWEDTLLGHRKQAIRKLNEIQTKKDQIKRRELLERIGLA